MNPVFVHAADLHLGAPLLSLGAGLTAEAKAELLLLVDKAFTNLIDKTIKYNAEFIVLAGDIYDDAENDARAQLRFFRGLKRLLDAGIGVYIAHGNHDPLLDEKKRNQIAKLPDGVHRFLPGSVQTVVHNLRDGGQVTVAGISFEKKDESENLALRFETVDRGSTQAIIGVLHTNVGGTVGKTSGLHANYAPCKVSDLRDSPVDYWALGHVHKRSVNYMDGNRYWAYPGNLQGRDIGETGEKGALVVEILPNGVGKPEFFSCDEIRFERIMLDCSTVEDIPGIQKVLETSFKDVDHTLPIVCRIHLIGASPAHRIISQTDAKVILDDLQSSCKDLLNGGYIEEIEKQTLPPIDINQLRDEDDLLGDLLKWTSKASLNEIEELVGVQSEGVQELLQTAEQLRQLIAKMEIMFLNDLFNTDEDEPQ
jgi:DNA repair exonuclease SbcCD nuclease subunit